MHRVVILLCMAALACACHQRIDHGGRTPLVEVEGMFLYAEDLENVKPVGLSRDDSVMFVEEYIRNWVQDALLWQKAMRNVDRNSEVEEMVEAYRRSLMLHLYQQALMEERVATEISQEEIDSFYRLTPHVYRLEYPLAKGLFIKVPLDGKEVNKVRQWYTRTDQESVEKLEKYSLQHAVDYHYFYNQWTRIDEVLKKMPVKVNDVSAYVKKFSEIEVKDTAFCYFLHIDSLLEVGDLKPVEYAAGEIRKALLSARQMEFMKQLREQLYEEAQADGDVTYYY
ncbi:MAG: peptidyl-prolyl cis-trans isomerase [Bacteroidaceae bacterium]|nr:peptidyl-prolyl cis-trans isomerase [Bacteroidaceae bacterium]